MAIFAKICKNRQIVKALNFKGFGHYFLCIFATTSIMVKDTILERKQPRFTETRKRGRTVSPSSCLLVARYILFHFIIYAPVPVRLVVIKCCFISAHFKHHLYVCGSDTASTVCYDPVGLVYTLSLKHCCYLIICL